MKTYDIDPVHLCQCGQYADHLELVEVLGGRYVEADAALTYINQLKAQIALLRDEVAVAKGGHGMRSDAFPR